MSRFDRRQMLRAACAGVAGCGMSGWFPSLSHALVGHPERRRRCILLWMSGGPSQTDTFDMKPNHENGGEFSEISTNVPGVRFSELLPKLAQQADKLAIVRSLSTKEGDHGRGTYLMRTGHTASNRLSYPTIGSSISMQLATGADTVPNYISIAPYTSLNPAAYSPGFLGPKHAP
jgi:hypothetical protein